MKVTILLIIAALGATLLAAPPGITVTAASRSKQPGELIVLTIVTARPAAPVRVRALDHDLLAFPVDATTWRVLVGIDLLVAPGTYQIAIEAGAGAAVERTTYSLVVKPRSFPKRKLTVDNAFVNPPPEAQARIEQEAQALTRIWDASAPSKLWDGAFVRPVPDSANSAFGTRTVLNGQPRSPHGGADFQSPAGRPIAAPGGGRVVFAGPLYYTGNTVVIDHGLTLFSLFAHLSAIDVHEGDLVKAGDVLGQVGATGRVTGPHLHWAVRVNGARVDPLSLLWVLGPPAANAKPAPPPARGWL